jgi:hypothetical protein
VLGVLSVSAPARAEDERAACADAHASGQDLRRAGRLTAARERFLACSRPACPSILRKECGEFLARVDAARPSVVIAVKDAHGADVVGARVAVDGADLRAEELALAVALDPGEHLLRASAGGRTGEARVLLREAERARGITLVLAEADARSAPRPPHVAPLGPIAPPPEAPRRPLPWSVPALGAVSVIALGLAAGFGADALSRDHRLQSCAPRCGPGAVDAMYGSARVADVSLGVSAAALVAAVVLYVVRPAVSEARALSGAAAGRAPRAE